MERMVLMAEDSVKIAADYYPAEGDKAVIFLHQFAKDRSSWEDLPALIRGKGMAVLVIDLRGHGESDGDYRYFKDGDFAEGMPRDVQAAMGFLAGNGKTNVFIVGS